MRFLLDTTLIYIYLSYILLRMFYLSVNISSSNSIFWNTMESSLFLGANVRGFLWLFLTTNLHPRERINRVCLIIIEFQPTYYQRKYVLRNHEKCGYPRTLTPANKNDSLYQTFVTIHPDYSSNTKNRFNALKFWSVFISKMLLKVNF